MSEQEFESYLRLLCRFLHLSGAQREKISRELRTHMEERLDDLIARGYSREDAITSALDEFGDAAALAGDFGRVGRRRRWIMRTTGGIVGIAAAVLFVSFLLPENRRHVPAPSYSAAADERGGSRAGGPPGSSQPARGKPMIGVTPEPKAEAEARIQLARVLPEVVFPEGSTLEQVVEFLRTQGKLSIDVNWNALSLVGVDRTATLSLDLHNTTLETALSLALENVGAASGVLLGHDVSDGVIRISTIEELNRKTFIRIYDCKDLIPAGFSDVQLKAISEFFKRQTDKPLSPSAELLNMNVRVAAEDAVVSLVKKLIAPGSWEPEGTTGSLNMYDGLLIVRHTSTVHSQFVGLLEMIRDAKLARGSSDTSGSLPHGASTVTEPLAGAGRNR